MNIGGEWTFDDWTVRMTPALHSSSLPNGQYGGLAAGFVLSHASEPTVYFAGDTALFSDMQLIGQRSKLDLAFLPIGGNFTMNVQEAIQAAQWLQVRTVIGMHYDTFGYIGIDQNQAKAWFANAGVQLELLNIGETRTY
jgi:L-ascorbate metabolism protein UlaG (beta-lactamase superfamily)